MGLCTELKVVNEDAASTSIPTATARIGQSFATRVLLGGRRGGASSQAAMGGLFIGRGRGLGFQQWAGSGDCFPPNGSLFGAQARAREVIDDVHARCRSTASSRATGRGLQRLSEVSNTCWAMATVASGASACARG